MFPLRYQKSVWMSLPRQYINPRQKVLDSLSHKYPVSSMKITIVELLLIAATATAIEWTDLRVTWKSPSLDPCHLSSYYQMPRTKADAISDGWVEVSGVTSLNLAVYCREGDGRVCLGYDTYGNIAAIQAALLYKDDADLRRVYNLPLMNNYQIKTIFNEKYLASTLYFISPETIAAGGRCETYDLTGNDGIWIGTRDGYMKIPRNVSYLDSEWRNDTCVPAMGTHYIHGMSTSSGCKATQPWILMAQDGQLSGLALLGLGKPTYRTRHYYEVITVAGVKNVFPTDSQCFVDWITEYGLVAMHIYFTSEPWEIQC